MGTAVGESNYITRTQVPTDTLQNHPWGLWSGREDLNLRPHGPEPCALADLRYAPKRQALYRSSLQLTSDAEGKTTPEHSTRIEDNMPAKLPCFPQCDILAKVPQGGNPVTHKLEGGAVSEKARVMIIEDDQDMIELLSLVLKRGAYVPIAAHGGKEGLRLLQETPVDLVLLDLMMDDMSGWNVLEVIKSDQQLRDIPVLILSARHHLEDRAQTESHASQFEAYLVKPFIVRDLLAQIQEVLQ